MRAQDPGVVIVVCALRARFLHLIHARLEAQIDGVERLRQVLAQGVAEVGDVALRVAQLLGALVPQQPPGEDQHERREQSARSQRDARRAQRA